MEKDVDAYRTISEVAEALDIPPHVLRFWETKFPQVKPLKRGGGRRYYRRADSDLLRTIRRLLYDEGYTIRGVQRLFKTKGAGAAADLLPAESASEPETSVSFDTLDTGKEVVAPRDGSDHQPVLASLRGEIASCRTLLEAALQSA